MASCNSRSPFTTFSQGRAIALFGIERSIALCEIKRSIVFQRNGAN
ncbi:hypothetical protein [Microcoleus sp. A003_D6]